VGHASAPPGDIDLPAGDGTTLPHVTLTLAPVGWEHGTINNDQIDPSLLQLFSNLHFSGLRKRLFFWSNSITLRVTHWCSSRVSVNIRMLSRYTTTTPSVIKSLKMSSIMVWNVAGLLHSPKNITSGSKSPWFFWNAAFHSSPSFIQTLLNPHQTSSLVKYLAPLSLLMSSEMRGSGYLFMTVIVFRAR